MKTNYIKEVFDVTQDYNLIFINVRDEANHHILI